MILTGSGTRRSPICSPACSSARPARRRASTRRATTRSTSSRSRSPRCRRPARATRRRPGWSTGCFRNLLVDVTGNTHRAEICIDKLYSPDGPTGRLGLVEFRGFEMPPDARMSLAQQLLIRALIARLWHEPLTGRSPAGARCCTTASCCRTSSGRTSSTCCATSPTTASTCAPTGSRRRPSSASPSAARSRPTASKLELRQALEPWHVLGETGAIGGTVRYTDSSVERLQVKLTTTDPDRYLVACNRRRLP